MPHPPADGWPLVPEAGQMTVTPGVLAPLPGSPATSARSSAASACAAPCARSRSSAPWLTSTAIAAAPASPALVLLLGVAAELAAHGGQHLAGELAEAARLEPLD